MARDPWARPHRRTLVLEGEPRELALARLDVGAVANVKLLLAIFRQQNDRLMRIAQEPIAQQLPAIAEEREANKQFGAWVEDALREGVRPVTPWTSADGVEVTDGASFVEAYQDEDLYAALLLLFDANTVSRATAKNSESPRDSSPGSPGGSQTARGDAPAPTAASADSSASATPAVAPDPTGPSPSGLTTAGASPSASSVPSAA